MIDFSNVKAVSIPAGVVTKIVATGKTLWEAVTFKNWVAFSTTNDGKTIYNGKGYKDGYRVRSGGAEGESSTAACTGFIPVKGGDIIRISGWNFSTAQSANAVNVSNASFTNLGQITPSYPDSGYGIFAAGAAYQSYCYQNAVTQEKTGVWKWTVPPATSGVAYIRVSGYNANGNHGKDMIVTINEEIN